MIKIVKKEEFSKHVESFHQKTNNSILDSIIHCALERGIELEAISSLLTADIKEKLEGEAMTLNLLNKKDVVDFD